MTRKRYLQLIESYKSNVVVEIHYETKHSKGEIKISAPFYLEKYKKIVRLLKNVKINDTSVYNIEIRKTYVLHTLCSLEQIKSFLERLGNIHEHD